MNNFQKLAKPSKMGLCELVLFLYLVANYNFLISRTRNLQLHMRKTDDIIKIKIKGLFDVIIGGNNMSENQVKITYKPLWKLLIDRDMTKTELRKKTQIAPSTFTKMNNNQQVSLDILARICVELKCGFDDIVEIER